MVVTEKLLQELDFEKVVVSPEEAGDDVGFYYYTLNILVDEDARGGVCLITNSNDEIDETGNWDVNILESGKSIYSEELLRDFIAVVKRIEEQNK